MEFGEALTGALRICGDHADDPILFANALCDTVGCDLLLQPQKECFLYFNKTFHLVSEIKQNPEPRMIETLLKHCKAHPDAPEKLCLSWLHTLFAFYDRANSDVGEQIEPRIPKSQSTQSRPLPLSISQIQVPRPLVTSEKASVNQAPSVSQIKVPKREHKKL